MDRITLKQHIEMHADRCGGRPCVQGTRIRVWDIHVWHDLRGESPEEIVAAFPQLTVADIHAALAYYLDHRDEIETLAAEDEALTAQEEANQPPSRFALLRDELLKRREAHGDSLPS